MSAVMTISNTQITLFALALLVGVFTFVVGRGALENYVNGDHTISWSMAAGLLAGGMISLSLLALGTPLSHWSIGEIAVADLGLAGTLIGTFQLMSRLQALPFDMDTTWRNDLSDALSVSVRPVLVFFAGLGICALALVI